MCECQGYPLARVTLALGAVSYLLVNRALVIYAQLYCLAQDFMVPGMYGLQIF